MPEKNREVFMQKEIKGHLGRYLIEILGILILSVIIGAILLIMVYALPTGEMKNNVQRATAIYDYEGVYPQLVAGYKMTQLDNCTDATMLLNAIFPGTGNVINDAMKTYRVEYKERNPVGSLTDFANDVVAEKRTVTYPRYWHGYLVILKPLLLFFDVADIRIINMFLQTTLFMYIIYLMMKRRLEKYIPLYVVSVLLLCPPALMVSFQFSTISYISLITVILVLKKQKWELKDKLFLFLLIGIVTAYFDFLTYPLVGLYFPMIFLLLKEKDWKKATKEVIAYSILWIIGYAGMWCGKWAVGSILTGNNLFFDVLSRAGEYTSMETDEATVTSLQVIARNIYVLVKWPIVILGGLTCAYLMKCLFHDLKTRKLELLQMMPFLIIAVAPFVWYVFAGLHSYYHYWFTFRILCVSVFALLVGLCKIRTE